MHTSRLGACQFLADLPFGSVTLVTIWKIFWNIYCKQSCSSGDGGSGARRMTVATDTGRDAGSRVRPSREFYPTNVNEIQEAMKSESKTFQRTPA